jgi:long-chain fatty acid transport protein
MKRALLAGGASFAVIMTTQAFAGSFALREQSARALGVSFAGAAAGGGGLSSMFWNPATITQYPGSTSSWTASGIFPYAKVTPTAGPTLPFGSAGNVGMEALTTASSSAYQWNQWLWLGLNVDTPFGLSTKTANNWAGQAYARTSKVISAEVTPTVAIKLNDMVSVGFGFRAMYFKTRLTRATGVAPGAPAAALEGDDWSYGFTAGVNFTPVEGTDIGVGYRSKMRPKLTGTLGTPLGVTPIISNLSLPDSITVGVRQKIGDRWTALAGYEWTNWSTFGSFPVLVRSGPGAGTQVTALKFNYRNGWAASLGAEYAYNSALTLRAGAAYEHSPITQEVRTARLPDANRIWASLGLTYNWSQKLSFDASYAHAFGLKGNIAYLPNHQDYVAPLRLTANTKTRLDIVSVGLTYRWDDPATVKTELPLVRKY